MDEIRSTAQAAYAVEYEQRFPNRKGARLA